MDDVLKQRLVGAAVLIALAVIFVPMLFDAPRDERLERQLDPAIPSSPERDDNIRRLPLDPNASRLRQDDGAGDADPAEPRLDDDADTEPADSGSEAPAQRLPMTTVDEPAGEEDTGEATQEDTGAGDKVSEADEAPRSDTGDDAPVGDPAADQQSRQDSEDNSALGASSAVSAEAIGPDTWRVQVASFGVEATAKEVVDALAERGHAARIDRIERGDSVLHRIQTGPYPDRERAEAAAQTIAEQVAGVAPVVRAPQAASAATDVSPGYAVQVGSFTSEDNAERLHAQLVGEGFEVFYFAESMGSREIWRVRVGTVAERDQAEALLERLRDEAGLEGLVVSHP
ncbi:MAG: SPOR domain-containing protein [Wenzhouxiangella sp.]|nr:SPOR domain-containing protein [Wenzhouxiangella sp.]MDR9452317.1 SPOR domain-containing protein [Wenzhouxiangella sp.]